MRALLLAAALLPGWTHVRTGLDGGSVWVGRIPNQVVTWDRRSSAVYLPPGFDPTRRYPAVYLLHGLRGAPSEYWDALDLADVADRARFRKACARVPSLHADALFCGRCAGRLQGWDSL